ncbi:hypothetical protein BCV69DRAFT_282864 [Microstroma glucosiphilum]|uniref:Indoleamine 2,3-dioxygenase n=1 Tax=Pseudomicrostroma glucosiphilum TaxID=1684307 RepID=A0A316UCB0_9BASI|nr:hypothetical protein BCV69DRAFT_282864 [Pseudomicrostroma glucosiphilum]PWN20645.1 hypothetical protein BCV69DRAFT_282864 [Pseudomicrostroma glucosiphilum]
MASPSSSPSSAGKQKAASPARQPIFPRWPESNEESEYWEVPPDHFLAQQDKATSRLYPASSSFLDYAYLDEQEAQAGPSRQASASDGSASPLPLAELARFMEASAGAPTAAPPIPVGMPDTTTLAGADFDIDVRSGFLPPEAPLDRLPAELPEAQWEHMLQQARIVGLKINGGGVAVDDAERARCRRWRRAMRELSPVTPSHKLRTDIRYARRGHVVLTFLAHFYIHSQPQATLLAEKGAHGSKTSSTNRWLTSLWAGKRNGMSNEQMAQDAQDARDELEGKYAARLPASISVPLLLLSSQLDLPPVLTYADTVLWNWRFKDASKGLVASNLEIVETFSGAPSEDHFFLTSLLIELRGVSALDIMRVCLDECFLGDSVAKRRVANYLDILVEVIGDLEQILRDVRTDCEPPTFYWAIRPWFRGGDSSPHRVKGWIYPANEWEDSLPSESLTPRLFTGPSAGQSSLIHALDVFFDVDHAGTKARVNRPPRRAVNRDGQVNADATDLPEDATFMQRMQLYMPGQHRRFLTHLQSLRADVATAPPVPVELSEGDIPTGPAEETPLRHLAATTLASSPTHALPKKYDAALGALRSLRDEHMRIATLYIVSQARSKPPPEYAALNAEFVGGTLEPKQQQQLKRRAEDEAEEEQAKAKAKKEAEAMEVEEKGAKGTGGTNLVQFLKACRINTVETLLGQVQAQAAALDEKVGEEAADADSPGSPHKRRRSQ